MVENHRSRTAEDMAVTILEANAISVDTINGFKWQSGIWSPIYSDLRLLMSNVDARTKTTDHLLSSMKDKASYDLIAGTATAGIVWATKIADSLRLPMAYVRGEDKKHGKQNRIEGVVNPGDKALVCEDTVSTGESSIDAAIALREKGANADDILGIMNYGLEESVANADIAGVEIVTATNFPTIMRIAEEGEYWRPSQVRAVHEWHRDPKGWKPTG